MSTQIKQALYIILFTIIIVVATAWYISSSADERYKQLEIEKEQIQEQLEQQQNVTNSLLAEYRQLTETQARIEEDRQRQLQQLTSALNSARAQIGGLRREVQAQQAQLSQQIAMVATTPDEQLAREIQDDLRETHVTSVFQFNTGEWFDANRPAAEAIKQRILSLESATLTESNQAAQITLYESQVDNLEEQLTLRQSSLSDCLQRAETCNDVIESFSLERERWQEAVQVRDEQIKVLAQKGLWNKIKKYGLLAAVAAGSFEAGRRAGGSP